MLISPLSYGQSRSSDFKSEPPKVSKQKLSSEFKKTPRVQKNELPKISIVNNEIPTEGLVGFYRFDENSYVDSSTSGFNLEVAEAGGAIFPYENRFEIGNRAIYLYGEYLTIASDPSAFNFDSDSNFSICTWVKIEETIIDWTAFVNNWAGFEIGGYYLGMTPNQEVRWNVNGEFPIDSYVIETGAWTHIAVTYNGENAELWLDGEFIGSQANNVDIIPSDFPFTIGTQANLPEVIFPGIIDDTVLYDRVLNTDEITEIFLDQALGSHENSIEGFSYHPNPINDVININSIENIKKVVIYNILGQKVFDQNINATSSQLNIANLETGSYLMKVSLDGKTASYKVLKN